jgi:cobalt-zinc-cadmium efflux system protein
VVTRTNHGKATAAISDPVVEITSATNNAAMGRVFSDPRITAARVYRRVDSRRRPSGKFSAVFGGNRVRLRLNGGVEETHGHAPSSAERRTLWVVLVANSALLVGELLAALAFGSLTLLAEAFHLLTDVSGLALAVLAVSLMARPATARHSYGLQRAEVLAAQANATILIAASGWVIFEAVRRLVHPVHVSGIALVAVGAVGLVVNLGSAALLRRDRGASLNTRGAFIHLASDALGSLGAILAGMAILVWGLRRADPAISLAIALLVLRAAWRLLRDTVHVLLEGTPHGMDAEEVKEALVVEKGVENIHHVHLWSLASDAPALSAHVVLAGDLSMHEAQLKGDELKDMLAERFNIRHATLELECHGHSSPDNADHQMEAKGI